MMNPEEFIKIKYNTEWWENISFEDGKKYHIRNVERFTQAWKNINVKIGPLISS
jgi:hypothetical protein